MKVAAPKPWNLRRFDVRAFSEAATSMEGLAELADMERLGQERHPDAQPVNPVRWALQGELRPGAAGKPAAWLHVLAELEFPVECQRCLGAVSVPLHVDRWFRFVEDEATAEAEDEHCEEDVLALEPKPDLLALIEDELLMAMPLVPMHDACPQAHGAAGSAETLRDGEGGPERPSPFASLLKLKR
jgi:uncharacterized protein